MNYRRRCRISSLFIGRRAVLAGFVAAAFVTAGALAASPEAGAQPTKAAYSFVTLNNSGDPTFNQLLGINSFGTIAGYFGSGAAGHPNKGYTLAQPHGSGDYTDLNFPSSAQTQVTGLNDKGTTVGFWSNSNNGIGMDANFGFVDVNGTFTNVNNPDVTSTPAVNQLLGVNKKDVAVGFYNDTAGNAHGYTFDIGSKTFSSVNPPGSPTSSTATGINNHGAISGFATIGGVTKAYFEAPDGTFTEAGFPSAQSTMALGLNDFGEVVGTYTDGAGNVHGFTWRPATGTFTEVDDPHASQTPAQGVQGTLVNGVNNAGQLVGFYADGSGNVNGMLAVPNSQGYYTVASDGGVFSFNAQFHGSAGNLHLNAPIVGMATTPDGRGYWLVASDGGVFTYGDANFFGSMGGKPLNEPIVGMAAAPNGEGYWLVASDGGIFTFGDANFVGSTGGMHLNAPIVGMTADPATGGYWMTASDGGVFSFNALFHGSMGGKPLNKPIVGISSTADGGGYWFVASDGGIFNFGDAPFLGSMGGKPLNKPVVGMAATTGAGYWLVASDGGIFNFGDAPFLGSMGGQQLNKPMVGMAGSALSD